MTRQTTIEKKKGKGKIQTERHTQTHNKQESPLNIIEN